MPTVLIAGANRGLGLEFCRQYADGGWKVLACCRRPAEARDLAQLAARHSTVLIHPLDVSDFAAVDRLSLQMSDESVDVLLCNAGVYGEDAAHGFGKLDYRRWLDTLVVNTQAPVKLAEAFLDQVRRSERRLIVAISSLMGSMTDNTSGGSILYRSSKAGLNAAMKSLALDLKPSGIGVLILHPGWVRTDMGGENAPTAPSESIAGMRRVIDGFSLADSGCFLNYRGQEMPW